MCITITTLFLLQILILSFHHKTALQEDTAMRSFYLIMWNVPPVEGSAESKKVSLSRVETDFQSNLVWTDSQSRVITTAAVQVQGHVRDVPSTLHLCPFKLIIQSAYTS